MYKPVTIGQPTLGNPAETKNPLLKIQTQDENQEGSTKLGKIDWIHKLTTELSTNPSAPEVNLSSLEKLDEQIWSAVKNLKDVKILNLGSHKIMAPQLVTLLKFSETVESLALSGQPSNDQRMKYLGSFSELKNLKLSGCEITDSLLTDLAKLENLKTIDLFDCKIENSAEITEAFENLEKSGIKINIVGSKEEEKTEVAPKSLSLSVSDNPVNFHAEQPESPKAKVETSSAKAAQLAGKQNQSEL